jgi:3(or 17)beta-hydroxysteroid dehydrogenase
MDQGKARKGRVEGKVAIVTGAASGLGAADARMLAEEGAKVVLTDINDEQGRAVAAAIPGAVFLHHDVRSEDEWVQVIAETERLHGRCDILVNNAGVVRFTSVEETTLEEFRWQNQIMSEGTFLGCKHVIPLMKKGGGGSIINMASVAAIKGVGPIISYSAAKGAIRSMSRTVAVYCQERNYNIRCNVLLPGAHDTPMTAAALALMPPTEPGLAQMQSRGQGKPEDVGYLVLFLASDESRQITGAEFVIDNGETI